MFALYLRLVAVDINKCIASVLYVLYSKVLRLSQKLLAVTSTKKLVTLVSRELQTMEKTFWYFPLLLVNVLVILLCFEYIILFFLGVGIIASVVILVLGVIWLTLMLKII